MRDTQATGCASAFFCGLAGAFILGVPTFFMVFFESFNWHSGTQGPKLAVLFSGPAAAFVGFVAGALLSLIRRRK
jgi:hypothetical protein